jgi:hypothetical protein
MQNSVSARVRYFDDFIMKHIDEGLEQLVILGAGYDTRATFNDFQNFLMIAKNGYNLREHSSFNYRSPVEIWNSSGVSLSVTAGGLWT